MFTLPQFKNYVPLTKSEILNLRGGSFRGESLYAYADLGPTRGYATFFVKVRNQMRSKNKAAAHPGGYLRLESDLCHSDQFRYDIASGNVRVYTAGVNYFGNPVWSWTSFPAWLYQPPATSEEAQLMRTDVSRTESLHLLLRAIYKHSADAETIAQIIAEELKLHIDIKTVEPAGRRILRYLPRIEAHVADSLREMILAQGPSHQNRTELPAAA